MARPFQVTKQGGFLCSLVRDLKSLYESNVKSVGNDGNGGPQEGNDKILSFYRPKKGWR